MLRDDLHAVLHGSSDVAQVALLVGRWSGSASDGCGVPGAGSGRADRASRRCQILIPRGRGTPRGRRGSVNVENRAEKRLRGERLVASRQIPNAGEAVDADHLSQCLSLVTDRRHVQVLSELIKLTEPLVLA